MTVYNGRTFQTCALRVWGVWVSMRDFHAATVTNRDLLPSFIRSDVRGIQGVKDQRSRDR
jgi:hypothetical protein